MSKIEKIENYHPNGMLSEKGVLKDGKQYGEWIYCYETGEKMEQVNFDENGNTQNGVCWYENGQKMVERKGFEEGVQTWWYENGHKEIQVTLKNGKENGLKSWWYKGGMKKTESLFKNGKPHGKTLKWYENGNKKFENNFKNGLHHGKQIGYDIDGKVNEVFYCKDGEFIPKKLWNEDGSINE